MSEKIQNSDLFEDGLFAGQPKKNAEVFLDIIKMLNDEFRDIAKSSQEAFKGSGIPETKKELDAFAKAEEEARAAVDQLNKSKQEELRLNKIVADQNRAAQKAAKNNLKSIGELKLEVRELNKTQRARIKDIDRLNKSLENVTDAQGENSKSAKILRDEIKRLTDQVDEGETEISQAKVQLTELNKVQRQAAKEAVGLVGEYERQSKTLIQLKKDYKDLAVAGMENTEEGQALLAQITELDDRLKDVDESVGDFGRSVGGYKNAVTEALSETDLFGDKLGVLGSINEKVSGILEKVTGNTLDYEKSNKKARRSIRGLRAGLAGAVVALAAVGAGLARSLSATQEFGDELDVLSAKASTTADVISGALGKQAASSLSQLQLGFAELFGTEEEAAAAREKAGKDLLDSIKAYSNLGDQISRANDAAERLVRSQQSFRDIRREIERSIIAFSQEEELRRSIADDATRSFKIREQAAEDSRIASTQRANEELRLRSKELEFINEEVELSKLASATGTANAAILDRQLEAQLALAEAEKEAALTAVENEKQRRELVQDRLERDLDILIDGFDNQKTINERIIADEKKTFAERRRLLEETVALSDDSFNKQIETIQKFTNIQVDANDLIATSDAVVLNEKIRALGLSEIIEGRLLEVIRDRRTATQDLNDATRDLNQQEQDRIKTLEDLLDASRQFNAEQLAATESRESRLVQLENARFERRKKELEIELGEQENFNLLIEELEKEHQERLDDIVLAETRDRNDAVLKEVELRAILSGKTQEEIAKDVRDTRIRLLEEEIEERLALQEETIDQELELAKLRGEIREEELEKDKELAKAREQIADALGDFLKRKSEERIKQIDKEISASEKRQDNFRALAQQGVESATQNLAFEQRRQAELERERERQVRRQARNELIIAGIKNFDGSSFETLGELGILIQGLKALPLFWEGTEHVGKSLGKPVFSGRDGYVVRVDEKERIVDGENNDKMSGISNDALGNMALMYKMGMLVPKGSVDNINVRTPYQTSEQLLNKFDELTKSVKGLPNKMPYYQMTFDEFEGMVLEIMKKNGKVTINKTKVRGRG